MPELAHLWGTDLAIGPTGDLGLVSATERGQQRVLRRLLTNPGDYIWRPDYGAGLARYIGQPGGESAIRAAIRGQIFKEDAVAQSPEPLIDVQFTTTGVASVHVRYADAATGSTQILSFSVGA